MECKWLHYSRDVPGSLCGEEGAKTAAWVLWLYRVLGAVPCWCISVPLGGVFRRALSALLSDSPGRLKKDLDIDI